MKDQIRIVCYSSANAKSGEKDNKLKKVLGILS